MSGGYQWDLEIRLRKLATCSAEIDTKQSSLVILPEPGRGGVGETEPGKLLVDQLAVKFRYGRAEFLPQVPLSWWNDSVRIDGSVCNSGAHLGNQERPGAADIYRSAKAGSPDHRLTRAPWGVWPSGLGESNNAQG